MSLWNPHAFSATGQPEPQVSPAALRVIGGVATPQQKAWAQGAFYQFCSRARLSMAPNPTEQGFLADGTRYRITVVGPQATMEIWPLGEDSETRRYGIGAIFTDLQGKPLAGHTLPNGQPQPYLFTPEPIKGTRTTQGKWKIRKVPSFVGGKATFCDAAGKLMAAAIPGALDDGGLTLSGGIERRIGINARAYWSAIGGSGTPVLSTGSKVTGEMRSGTEPVPFFRKASDGTVWIMSIVALSAARRIVLYGAQYTGQPFTGPIGDELGYVDLPSPYTLKWQTLSVKPDGTNIRMVAGGVFGQTSKTDIPVVEVAGNPPSFTLGGASIGPVEDIETPGKVVIVNFGDSNAGYYGATTTYEAGRVRVSGGYGYGPAGDDLSYTVSQPSSISRRSGFERYTRRVSVTEDGSGGGTTEEWNTTSGSLSEAAISYEFGDSSVVIPGSTQNYSTNGYSSVTRNKFGEIVASANESTTSGGTSQLVDLNVLFVDVPNGIAVITAGRVTTTYSTSSSGGSSSETRDEVSSRETAIWHKSTKIFAVDHSSRPDVIYVVAAAADPLTGAVILNLLELPAANAQATNSWIYLVDDTGARPLSQVMPIPSNARVQSDAALLSVV